MYLGIVKLLGRNNESIPSCPFPLEDGKKHQNLCVFGLNIYTKQEHTGFNSIIRNLNPEEMYPVMPENSPFLAGKDLTRELEMQNITTIDDMAKISFRSLVSYTNKPYPGLSNFFTPNIPSPTFPVCTTKAG